MTIQMFDDFDAMFDAIDKGVEKAQAMTLPVQERITYGDYWMRYWEDFLIFGYIHTSEEVEAKERELGADDAEILYERRMMLSSYNRGFRFGTAYSTLCPEGELGDTHVASMVPLTREEFEQARELGWNTEEIIQTDWFNTAVERFFRAN